MSIALPPSSYATIAPTTLSYLGSSSSATSTIALSLSQTSNTHISSHVTSIPSATVSQSSITSSSASSSDFVQLAGYMGRAAGAAMPTSSILAANYQQLCPQGNCYKDCQNTKRVFESLPEGIKANPSRYGKTDASNRYPDVTLFGVCSNLVNVSTMARSRSFASYFPDDPGAIQSVNIDISMCLLDTCSATRDPVTCRDQCSIDKIRPGKFVSANSMLDCMNALCSSTCALPYANQDVFGVGLLASYITQAVLVLILSAVFIVSASWQYFRQHKNDRPSIPESLEDSMGTFLTAQCYFGVSAAIASYFMHPSTIDPLNGYALLSVAITGFLPTTFTLMLLHNHGIKSWYSTFLTCASWLFSSVLFFILLAHLSKSVDNPRILDEGLSTLFHVETCGGSSALSLCRQMFDTDPMSYLSYFYNYWNIPNVKNVAVLWVLSTLTLLCLVGLQLYDTVRGHGRKRKPSPVIRLATLYSGSTLFGLALGYQARMVIAYTRIGVIDWNSWTFGQVVALLFWVPALIDCVRSYVKKQRSKATGSSNTYTKLEKGSTPSSITSLPIPAQTSSPSVGHGYEPLRTGQRTGDTTPQFGAVPRKPVASASARATTT